jgi:hypothetical protein
MARKTRTELHDLYGRRIELSRRWHEQEGFNETWRRMIDLYRGRHWPRSAGMGKDLITVNLAFSTINVIGPSVSVNHPKLVVHANNEEDEDRALFVEAVINHLWKHHDFLQPFQQAVKDFLIIGHGWVKVGWRFTEQERTLSSVERQGLIDAAIFEVDEAAAEMPEFAGELVSEEEVAANIPQSELSVVEDQPFVERVSPFDVLVDPEATSEADMGWIAQRIVRPLEDVQQDDKYKPSERKRLTADARVLTGYDNLFSDDREQYTPDERVVIWEFYDIPRNTMCVFAENGDGFLVDPTPMPYAFGQPFVMLRNYNVPDHFYPLGELEPIESLQLELDKTRTQLMNDRKRYARKYLYHERSFGPEGREALESDEDSRMVPVVDENKPLSEVVVPMPQIQISPEIYQYSDIIEADIMQVSGVSEYARGAMPEIRRTATEASIIADAQNARAADKLAIIELSIAKIGRRVVQLMQQYMTGEQMARVMKRGGGSLWIPYSREDIIGEYDFTVVAGSTQPLNDTIRKQQAISLMNAVAPLVGAGVIDPTALAIHILQDGFGITDPERFISQQPPLPPPATGDAAAGAPMAPPPPTAPPPVGGGAPLPPEGAFAPTGGIPPELLAQLQNQMGMDLPAL